MFTFHLLSRFIATCNWIRNVCFEKKIPTSTYLHFFHSIMKVRKCSNIFHAVCFQSSIRIEILYTCMIFLSYFSFQAFCLDPNAVQWNPSNSITLGTGQWSHKRGGSIWEVLGLDTMLMIITTDRLRLCKGNDEMNVLILLHFYSHYRVFYLK